MLLQEVFDVFWLLGAIHAPYIPADYFIHLGLKPLPPPLLLNPHFTSNLVPSVLERNW